MFRRRKSDDGLGLPTTSGNSPTPSRFGFGGGSSNNNTNGGSSYGAAYGGNDGSAASIHLQSPVVRALKNSSRSVRISYACVIGFLCMISLGFRWIRSQNASVWLTCHKQECHLQISPTGIKTGISLHFARKQLVGTLPVKTLQDGTFVTQDAIKLNEEWKQRASNKKGKKGSSKHTPSSSSNTYKGPDEHGFYLSYALLLRDKEPTNGTMEEEDEGKSAGTSSGLVIEEDIIEAQDVDLSPVRPYLDATDEPGVHRLTLRKFRLSQTKRRVRTMTQKVDSYIKKRRHKLLLKENAPPSWQGILLCVIGLIGVLLSFLLGQFWDEAPGSSGPGVRRQRKHLPHDNPRKPKSIDNSVMQTQTPARYEVASGPKPLGMRKRST